ncbi:hypothetical protein BXQ17_10215 [Polaribacter sp. BM10]|uniref:hypothetical protein n=1 Tax=Polaribacter sp. BM10 TaxID=1529069 RepID=UPI000989DC83|nr:hypothetical protein [Polaribacter sp. BM10]AQS94414.1 hypothetical protein BXQ17_10215 [Polaribacter sp. BM10]
MKKHYLIKICCLLFTVAHINLNLQAQEKQSIDSLFLNNSAHFKEVVYAHLNKSIYIKGENIGFTAYSFDKYKNNLSKSTSNLYCLIYDSNKKLVKKQLLKVENGIANGVFDVDKDFKTGTYSFKAYTNWMLNFSEESFFTDSFEVIDPQETKVVAKTKNNGKIDLQILPESGHLLTGVINTLGVVAKDSLGYGISNLKGSVLDQQNNFITSFKLNDLGIGRFSMKPIKNKTYKVQLENTKDFITNFGANSKNSGIIIQLNSNENEVIISCVTNKGTLPFLKGKTYTLAYQNRAKLTKIEIQFDKENVISKKIALKNLKSGITIFTLFDEQNNPIAERLFFNYKNININTIENASVNNSKDTLHNFNFNFKNGFKDFNNVSISILPESTKSYNKNSNIISNVLIKPYIKGYLQNGGYYFTDINSQKKYDLDNLLITQGWSSFNWRKLFSQKNKFAHSFEKGITVRFNIQNEKNSQKQFLIHALSNNPPQFISLNDNSKSAFVLNNYYPTNNEKAYISSIRKKDGKTFKTPLYTQFFPSYIPETNKTANHLSTNSNFYATENPNQLTSFNRLNTGDFLDEVIIKTNLEEERILEIRKKSFGRVKFTTLQDSYITLEEYINSYSIDFYAVKNHLKGTLDIGRSNSKLFQNLTTKRDFGGTLVYLDGQRVLDSSILLNFSMSIVDYVEFDKSSFTEGFTNGQGVIRIVTDPMKFYQPIKRQTTTEIKFPITFSKAKKFYIPKYNSYTDNFYKKYGVVDWLPMNKIDENGNLNLDVKNIKTDKITLFFEGVSSNGEFIFDKKTLEITPSKLF